MKTISVGTKVAKGAFVAPILGNMYMMYNIIVIDTYSVKPAHMTNISEQNYTLYCLALFCLIIALFYVYTTLQFRETSIKCSMFTIYSPS